MKSKRRLMWTIFSFLLGFCALLLTILWLFQTVFLGKMYEGIRKSEIRQAIALVEKNIDSPSLSQLIKSLADDQEIIVSTPNEFKIPPSPDQGKPPVRLAITEVRDFTTAEGRTVTLVFHAIISPVQATIATIKVQLTYVTIIMLVLSVVLALVIARIVSLPIERLNQSAKILAGGDYNTHFSSGGYREIHELSDTLNLAASELSKVDRLRRELMANVSHDLRTPLALIYGYAEMMSDFPDEIDAEKVRLIMEETERMSSLVSDMLDVSSLESGVMELNTHFYNLTGSITQTINRLTGLVGKEGYSFDFQPDQDVYLLADEVKLTQAFYNLLVNAIHYSGPSRQVRIRQILDNRTVRIEVEDEGGGIREEDMPYIWDRYYKGSEAHKRAIMGTGLGLSIVKKIIELHGGLYGVESKPGQGSVFWFQIDRL